MVSSFWVLRPRMRSQWMSNNCTYSSHCIWLFTRCMRGCSIVSYICRLLVSYLFVPISFHPFLYFPLHPVADLPKEITFHQIRPNCTLAKISKLAQVKSVARKDQFGAHTSEFTFIYDARFVMICVMGQFWPLSYRIPSFRAIFYLVTTLE